MKKAVALSLILLMLAAALVSCTKPSTDTPSTTISTSSVTAELSSSITNPPVGSTAANASISTVDPTTANPIDNQSAEAPRANTKQLKFDAQVIQTFGYHSDRQYPIVTVISTKNELTQYCKNYENDYRFTSDGAGEPNDNQPGVTISFADATEKYTDDFFKDNYLVVVLLEDGLEKEYRVESVTESGDIVIRRFNPRLSLLTRTAWSIVIKLNNESKPKNFKVDMINEAVS